MGSLSAGKKNGLWFWAIEIGGYKVELLYGKPEVVVALFELCPGSVIVFRRRTRVLRIQLGKKLSDEIS